MNIGQYLSMRYGPFVVFAARYLAVLRSVIGLLAGVNRMKWSPFMIANAAGAIACAYYFGTPAAQLSAQMEFSLIAAAGVVVTTALVLLRRYEKELSRQAEQNLCS
jgi:membrane protein DedA with SNARE-associated domain